MNSEKVKELKEFIEGSAKLGCYYKLANCDITMLEVLEYINELESENKTLLESCKNCHYIKDLEIANKHTKELKDRIAELEKENETKTDTIIDLLKKQEFYETEKLKQFATLLKVKTVLTPSGWCVNIEDIDETLKEFINES